MGTFYVPTTGDYTLYAVFLKASSSGIMHFYVDSADVAQLDCYDAGDIWNAKESVSLGSLAAGIHTLSIKIASKNASSADYATRIQGLCIVKT